MMKRTLSVLLLTLCLTLSSQMASAETITLSTLNWEPFYGEKLPENGFLAALSREAFKRIGYDMELVFLPWKRALEMARTGKYDGLLGAYYSEDRNSTFDYTDSIAQNEEVFIANKGSGIKYANIEDLKQYKIGGLRGGAPATELQEKGFNIDLVADDTLSIKKLNAKRIDLIIMGKQQLFYMLQNNKDLQQFQGTFDILEPPFKLYDLYCPITKARTDGAEIVEKFNKALQEMKADVTYDAIMKRFGQGQ